MTRAVENSKVIILLYFALSTFFVYSQDETLIWDGETRYYRVHIPSSYSSSSPSPLIIAMHGGFGSGTQLENQSQLSVKAEQEGFIVVYPDGIKSSLGIRTWNADGCCGYAVTNNIDDVGFINNLLDTLENKYNIDTDKVYATGMSNGAFMSYRLACELSNRIAAIAPVAGTMNVKLCSTSRQVPIIHFHSYLDNSVPHLGGKGTGVSNHYNPPLDSVLSIWGTKNKCSSIDTLQNDANLLHVKWSKCLCASQNELYLTRDGGHSWHGGIKTTTGDNVSQAVNANDKMWQFFVDNPLCSVSTDNPNNYNAAVTPNPFNSYFRLSVGRTSSATQFIIYDSFGQVKTKGALKKETTVKHINTEKLTSGMYFIVVQTEERLLTIKVVKH